MKMRVLLDVYISLLIHEVWFFEKTATLSLLENTNFGQGGTGFLVTGLLKFSDIYSTLSYPPTRNTAKCALQYLTPPISEFLLKIC